MLRSRHPSHPAPIADAELDRVWNTLCDDGLAPVVFHDGGVRCAADLRGLLAPHRAWCYLVQTADTPLALCWLDGFCGRAARIHFCVLRAGLPRADEIGHMVVHFLLHAQAPVPSPGPNGRPATHLLDTLVGLTPAPYRHALAFVTRLGFRRAAVIPGGAVLARPAGTRVCDAVLTLCTRSDLPDSRRPASSSPTGPLPQPGAPGHSRLPQP
ncbi:hypothetical protein [Nitratidesulfovibrio oxamicus]|uniref:hypothetical protein n=1 Tax=Nitratidesulfovibrio oxamicus TaxID=32016 RepID=UPI0027DE77FA|nr:hypothetical protein [Nitratidesulfovibrio oxamicus]